MKRVEKVKHIVKGWEKKYGYLGITVSEREFFAPLLNQTFTINFCGINLSNRTYIERYKRISLGPKVFSEIQVGDTLICYRDKKGNYFIEKRQPKTLGFRMQ